MSTLAGGSVKQVGAGKIDDFAAPSVDHGLGCQIACNGRFDKLFGLGALNCKLTRSCGRRDGIALSLTVVFTRFDADIDDIASDPMLWINA